MSDVAVYDVIQPFGNCASILMNVVLPNAQKHRIVPERKANS